MPFKDKQANRDYFRVWIKNRRAEAIARHGGCCLQCGSEESLEFHHRDRKDKVTHRVFSWAIQRMEAELSKCDLLCAKCHLQETRKERGILPYTHGTERSYNWGKCRCDLCRVAATDKARVRRLTRLLAGYEIAEPL